MAVIVLPVRIIMFPTCSNRLLAGRNALSATVRTIYRSPPPMAASSGPGNGHPDETLTRHQFISAPTGPHFGATSQVAAAGLAELLALETVSHLWAGGVGGHLLQPGARLALALAIALGFVAGARQALEQLVAGLLQLGHVGDVALGAEQRMRRLALLRASG